MSRGVRVSGFPTRQRGLSSTTAIAISTTSLPLNSQGTPFSNLSSGPTFTPGPHTITGELHWRFTSFQPNGPSSPATSPSPKARQRRRCSPVANPVRLVAHRPHGTRSILPAGAFRPPARSAVFSGNSQLRRNARCVKASVPRLVMRRQSDFSKPILFPQARPVLPHGSWATPITPPPLLHPSRSMLLPTSPSLSRAQMVPP